MTRNPWLGLAVLVLPVLLVSIDITALFFALPFIAADLHPSAPQQLWVMDAYGFVLAGLLVTMGAVADRFGRRRVLLAGALVFGVGSVLGATAASPDALIAARALMGVGGATLMPSTLALIRVLLHDDRQRGTAIAIWTAAMSGGAALGPLLGGVLLHRFDWGAVLLVNVPVMAALLVLGPLLLPESRGAARGRVDVRSALLSLGAILPLVWGIKAAALDGVGPGPVVAMVAGIGIGWAFVARQRALPDPLLDLGLFAERRLRSALTVNVVAMFALVGFAAFTTQYLQAVLGLDPLAAALWTLPAPASVGLVAPAAIALSRRLGPAPVVAGALLVAAAGFGLLATTPAAHGLVTVVGGATLLAAGVSGALTLITDLVVAAAPAERTGTAAALAETGSELGGALGVALLGAVGAAVYHAHMAGAPAAAAATLGGAVGTASAPAAHAAFAAGMHVAALVGTAVLLVTAVVALTGLRRAAPAGVPGLGETEVPAGPAALS